MGLARYPEKGIADVAEQASRIGCGIEAVRNARKRVKRRVEAPAKRTTKNDR